jgi:hypothetical protein
MGYRLIGIAYLMAYIADEVYRYDYYDNRRTRRI